jgi:hypothetical protein
MVGDDVAAVRVLGRDVFGPGEEGVNVIVVVGKGVCARFAVPCSLLLCV